MIIDNLMHLHIYMQLIMPMRLGDCEATTLREIELGEEKQTKFLKSLSKTLG